MPYKNPEDAKAAKAKWYQENKQSVAETNARRNRKVTQVILDAKSVPCADCKVQYPYYVMQFDHIGTGDKVGDVTKLARSHGLQAVIDEIAKCEVVCANCHSIRTYERL